MVDLTFVKSFDKFDFRIIDSSSVYTDKTPYGVLNIEIEYNRPDELVAMLFDVDKATSTEHETFEVDLEPIKRGDFLEAKLDGDVIFYGEIVVKSARNRPGLRAIEVVANSLERLLAEIQLNRVIFNGFRDALEWEVDSNLQSDIAEGIPPIVSAHYFQPFGQYDYRVGGPDIENVANGSRIAWNGATNKRVISVLMKPPGLSIEKLWLGLVDPGVLTGSDGNPDLFPDGLRVKLVQVVDDTATGTFPADYIPDQAEVLTRRSGRDAVAIIGTDVVETWKNATGVAAGKVTGSTLDWDVVQNTDTVAVTATAAIDMGWLNYITMSHTAGASNNCSIETDYPDTALYPSPSGWLTFCTRFPTASSASVETHYTVYVEGDKPALRIKANGSGSLVLEHGGGTTTVTAISTGTSGLFIYRFHFRINVKKMVFDAWWTLGSPITATDFNTIGENFDFIGKDTFTAIPSKITKYRAETVGRASGDVTAAVEVGYWNGNEIPFYNAGNLNIFSQVDFSDDPIDVVPDHFIAVLLEVNADSARSDEAGINLNTTSVLDKARLRPDVRTVQSADADVGSPSWAKLVINSLEYEMNFMVEFTNSWVPAIEGWEYTVDYVNKKIDWGQGAFRAGVLKRTVFQGQLENNPASFKTVRVSEYANPSSGGIIESSNEMRVSDIVEHLASFVSTIASTDASDFNTSTYDRGSYQIKKSSPLEALRDLASQHNGIFRLTPEASPTLTFELAKDISALDPYSLSDHEYVVTIDRDLLPGLEDQAIIQDHNIGPNHNEVFTTFPVGGADPSKQVVFTNWALVTTLGREIVRKKEIFSEETIIENLWAFATALNDVFGLQIIEGEMIVDGYFPEKDNRLDINAIIRVIDPHIDNGSLISTGTGNVFKVHKLIYDGEENKTTIFLSNRNLHRATQERLNELRSVLSGIDPSDPKINIDRHVLGTSLTDPASNYPSLYMSLWDSVTGKEMDSIGYQRQLCDLKVHGTYASYVAFFPIETGTIDSDQFPIDRIRLYENRTQTETVLVTGSTDGTYDIIIDGVSHQYVAVSKTVLEIRDGLIAAINGGTIPHVFATTPDPDDSATVVVEGVGHKSHTISVSSTGSTLTLTAESHVNTVDLATTQKVYKWDNATLHVVYDVPVGGA